MLTSIKNGAFNRKAGIGDERDFRWAVDLEGGGILPPTVDHETKSTWPVMRVTNGEFYTRTRTLPLLRNRGDGTFEYFGSAADEIAADLFVDAGDVVLRSTNSGKEILRLKDKPGTTYEIVAENEFMTEAHAASVGHFSYYYHLITKPRDEWYDFKVADDTVSSAHHAIAMARYVSPGSDRAPCMPWGFGKRKNSLK